MQNSLERIFEGLCIALRNIILPEVSDPYARIQVEAAAGLLSNLAVRVEWRCADLVDEVAATREVLEIATATDDGDAPELAPARSLLVEPIPGDGENASLVAARAAHLEALAAVQTWAAGLDEPVAGTVKEALQRLMADRLEAELALLAAARRPRARSDRPASP